MEFYSLKFTWMVQGFFLESAFSSILFLLKSKIYYCVHKNLLSLDLIKPLNGTCTLLRFVYIFIFIFFIQSVQLSMEPAYEVYKPADIIHMNNLFCVM